MLSVTLRRTAVVASGAALILVGAVSAAFASPSVSVATSATIGHAILTDDQGMTLYRLTRDQNGTSSCFDACATAWPAVVVDAVPVESDAALAQNLGLSPRPDGTQQLNSRTSRYIATSATASLATPMARAAAASGSWSTHLPPPHRLRPGPRRRQAIDPEVVTESNRRSRTLERLSSSEPPSLDRPALAVRLLCRHHHGACPSVEIWPPPAARETR